MYHLATLFPILRRIRIPVTRDQVLLIMAAINEIFLGIDIYLAHSLSGTIVPEEWIPIYYGLAAGVILIVSVVILMKNRNVGSIIITLIMIGSIFVGFVGWYFHLLRATALSGPLEDQVSLALLVWAPPFVAPLTFGLVGLWGITALWKEDPLDSGRIFFIFGVESRLPFSKTRAYALMVGMGILACVVSSTLDHARGGFENHWLLVPVGVGIFAMISALMLGFIKKPSKGDLWAYLISMLALCLVGVLGAYLHISADLTSQGEIVYERFIRGAPFLAPLLFADMGGLGLIILMDPADKPKKES